MVAGLSSSVGRTKVALWLFVLAIGGVTLAVFILMSQPKRPRPGAPPPQDEDDPPA